MKNFFCILVFLSVSLNSYGQDSTVTTFDHVHQGFGSGLGTRTVIDTFLLPQDLSGYNQINMHILLNCPTGGCDPWDRFASIRAFHEGEWYEIGRYITPYGRSCGWTIDVSDYRSMLSDTVILNSFIDTWTNPGWLVTIDFEFVSGVPVYPDIKVENLWFNYNTVYGDSTQPVSLPVMSKTVDADAGSVKLKIINTGHGQGNLNNAAEFSQKTHLIFVNGTQSFSQVLWRSNCLSNPCSPQNGTWHYNRAGWCPGADVIPSTYDLTSLITPGQPVDLEYRLQSYFNTCNPNNAACVTGVTCTDCNYNYTGHTEPHYKIAAQLISYISTPAAIIDQESVFDFSIAPNPSNGNVDLKIKGRAGNYKVDLVGLLGNSLITVQATAGRQSINFSEMANGIYFLKVSGHGIEQVRKLVIE